MRKALIAVVLLLVGAVVVLVGSEEASTPLPPGTVAESVLVVKSKHRMTLLNNGKELKSYQVALGRGSRAAKMRQGDDEIWRAVPDGTPITIKP